MATSLRETIRAHWFIIAVVLFTLTNLVVISHAAAQAPTPIPTPNPIVTGTVRAAEVATGTLENFFTRLTQVPQSNVMRVLMIVIGLVLLVAGWRIYEFVIIIAGAIIGASVATSLFVTNEAITNLLILLVGGLIGAVLSVFLYYIAVFLIGAHLGIVVTNGLAVFFSLTPVSTLALIIGGLIGGLILVGLSFEFLILLSSLVGGQLLSLGLGLGVGWTLIFAIIGIVIQFALTRAYHYDFRRRYRYYTFRNWART